MSYIIKDDLLVDHEYIETPLTSGSMNPKFIVLHSYGYTREDTERIFTGGYPGIKLSAHLSINLSGSITQFAPFTAKTWHAGASYFQGHHGLNNCAIGIDVAQMGSNAPRKSYQSAEFSEETKETLLKFLPVLVDTYKIRSITTGFQVSLAQSDFNFECMSNLPLDRYSRFVEHGNADSLGRYAVTSPQVLNVRGGPDVKFEKIGELTAGEGVKVYRELGDWSFVAFERRGSDPWQGWVFSGYLRRL